MENKSLVNTMENKTLISPQAPALPLEATTAPVDASITKPEAVASTTARGDSVSSSSSLGDHEKRLRDPETAGNAATTTAAAGDVTPPNGVDRPDLARQPSQAPSEYPPPRQVFVVMVAILLSVFLMSLDRTIIATAIPAITDEFNSLQDIGWYASAFMLTACCFQLLLGRVYTFYPPKYVFLTLIGIFEIGSAICGAAPNSIAFIIGRAIAGVGSAGIMSGAIILMVSVVPLAKRPQYQGFFGAVFGVSSVIGPLLGGAFTTNVSWRWCFYINLPIGGASMLAILFLLKPTPPQNPGLSLWQQLARLDLLGEFFLLPSIVCLLLALQWAGTTYAFSSWRIILLFTLFGATFLAFIAVQILRPQTATIPLRLITNRSILAGMWFTTCLAGTMMILVYYISIWFQAIKGTTAVQSGIDTIPMVLALVVGSIAAGQLVGRIGYYTPLMIASAVIMPIGAGLIYTWNLETSEGAWIGYQILLGIGVGLGMQQGAMAAQTVLAKLDVPMGVSIMMFMQQFSGAIFVSVAQNVFGAALVANLVATVPGLSPMMIVNTGATNLRGLVSDPEELREVLTAYNGALQRVFLVAVVLACLAIFGAAAMQWRSVKGKGGPLAKGQKDGKSEEEKRREEEQGPAREKVEGEV